MTSAQLGASIALEELLDPKRLPRRLRLAIFGGLVRTISGQLRCGALTPCEAVHLFFNAENCLFVSQTLRSAAANEIMGRGVQLDDLSEVLPPRAASREILVELNTIDRLAAALADGTQRKPRRRT